MGLGFRSEAVGGRAKRDMTEAAPGQLQTEATPAGVANGNQCRRRTASVQGLLDSQGGPQVHDPRWIFHRGQPGRRELGEAV